MENNIFDVAAAAAAPKTTKSSSKKQVFLMDGDKPARYNWLKNKFKEIEAELAMVGDDIKNFAKEQFVKLYDKDGCKPESFNIMGTKGGQVMYIVQDRYAKVTPDKAAILGQLPDVLDTVVRYEINPDIVKKYGSKISEALRAIVSEDEIDTMLTVTKEYSVKSGTINRMNVVGTEYLDIVSPISMLK